MPNDRLAAIRDLIDRADHAYYISGVGTLMEDSVYDGLKDELKGLAPDDVRLKRVGAPIPADSMLTKREHAIPMGSQEKAMNRAEFLAWVDGLPNGRATRLHADLKADGGSVSFEFVGGTLFRAITRGDGFVGEDVTANARKFKAIPGMVVNELREPFTGTVRAEVVLTVADWKTADPELTSNPRNLATGICRRKDSSQSELLTAIAFRAYNGQGKEVAATEAQMNRELQALGFATPRCITGDHEAIWAFVEAITAERNNIFHWIDGIVVKVDDMEDQNALGATDNRPKGQVAVKFEAQGEKTTLRSVELSVGHTGAIIPTAKFDSVAVGGTNVASALLCNWDEIAALDVAVGDEIFVTKQGDIIPKVSRVISRPANRQVIPEPTTCPVCSGPIGRKSNVGGDESALIFCLNDECDAKTSGKIKRWLTSLNILGIGDEVLDAIIAQLGVMDAADLYALRTKAAELAAVTTGNVRVGDKRAAKIIEQIEATREISVSAFIGSLGIDALGKRRVELIQKSVPGQMDTIEDWMSAKLETIAEQAGVPNVATKIVRDLLKKRPLIDRLLAAGVVPKADTPVALAAADAPSFCFTGALSQPRDHYAGLVKAKGWVVKDDVSKGLTYLVIADPNSTSSKAVKARKAGTRCISEAELLAMLAG